MPLPPVTCRSAIAKCFAIIALSMTASVAKSARGRLLVEESGAPRPERGWPWQDRAQEKIYAGLRGRPCDGSTQRVDAGPAEFSAPEKDPRPERGPG
jgi:hypothetical protein